MARILSHSGLLLVVVIGCAAAPGKRARPDAQAIEEVRATASSGENFSSSASYSHFLKSRLLHHAGEHRQSLNELRLALVTDDENPYLLVALAEEYARIGDLDRSERTLRKVIERNPRHHQAQLLMGRVLGEQKKLSRARQHLKRAIKLEPSDAEPYFMLAQVELEANRPDEAIAVVEAMSRAVPDDSRAFRILGIVFSERGDSMRAERMLRRAVQIFPGDFDAWSRLAQIFEESERHGQAEEAYAEALQRDPDNVDLLLNAGRVSLKIGSESRARAWFDRILSLTDDPETAVRVSFAYLSADRLAAAADVLDRARGRAGPGGEPRLAFYSALMHEKLKDFSRAADAYGAIPSGSDLYPEARLRRASALSLSGKHRPALEELRKLQADQPDYVAMFPPYARALERSGSLKDAERLLRGALARSSSKKTQSSALPELYEALAQNLQRQGRNKEALTLLEDAVASRQDDAALRFLLASHYERQGQLDRSLAEMRKVLAASPDNAAALNFVGYVLADHGRDFDEAERLVKRALELKPDSGAFLDSLGWVYFRKGEAAKAVEYLERAAALEPDEAVIIEHLADAYARTDRLQDAARMYERALEALASSDEPVDARRLRQGIEKKLRRLSTESAERKL